ncbi:hypothetical protein QNO07_04335 [Streptomyces sp. 549]|uniref:hypothetical protein n=1 Tax=Streptomyces sp. 549 TaxID=3049076 RepID=UPI0024C366A6|nr:hypothetical protein [Streptomyces sp. 549]MDK1472660.1 hypothetical protein [Streptomyces sp. 549]
MYSTEQTAKDVQKSLEMDVDAALNPAEADGTYRDSRECAALLLLAGALLLSPPTPRPKKG